MLISCRRAHTSVWGDGAGLCWAGRAGWEAAAPWVCQALSRQMLLCAPCSEDFIIKEAKEIHEETQEKYMYI